MNLDDSFRRNEAEDVVAVNRVAALGKAVVDALDVVADDNDIVGGSSFIVGTLRLHHVLARRNAP